MTNTSALSCSADSGSGEDKNGFSTAIGISIGLFASVGINLGINLRAEESQRVSNIIGWLLFVVSSIANFVAFAFAPASVLAPLEGAQFVTNLGYMLLNKKTPLWTEGGMKLDWNVFYQALFGTLLVVAGIVLPVASSPSEVAVFDESIIWCFWSGTEWIVYFVCTSTIAIGFYFLRRMLYDLSNDKRTPTKLEKLLYAMPAAIFGGLGVVQAKAISELVEPVFTGGDITMVVTMFLFYLTLVLMLVGLVPWVLRQAEAPGLFGLEINPLMQGLYIIFSSLGGGIFFREFDDFSTSQAVMFASGLSLIAAGASLTMPGKAKEAGKNQSGELSRLEESGELPLLLNM